MKGTCHTSHILGDMLHTEKITQKAQQEKTNRSHYFQQKFSNLDHESQTDLRLSPALSFTSLVTLGKQYLF